MKLQSAYDLKREARQILSSPRTSRRSTFSKGLAHFALLNETTTPLDRSGIVGLGISRASDHPDSYQLAVRYRSGSDKRTQEALENLKDLAQGEIDAQETGDIRFANWHRTGQRPCCIGTSIGVDGLNGAGTLGAFARRADDEALYVLSNNHVLTGEQGISRGTPILQPGMYDGGTSADRIASLSDWVDIDVTPGTPNDVDAAIARVDDGVEVDRKHLEHLGKLIGTSDAEARFAAGENIRAHKVGRTTEKTSGLVTAVDFDLTLVFAGHYVFFENQIEIAGNQGAMGAQGDSGSMLVDDQLQGIGLFFAVARNGNGYANHIEPVLNSLQLRLAI